jgi:hypothetical protein
MMETETPRAARAFAAFLVVLGVATISTNLAGLARSGSDDLSRLMLAVLYGVAAVVAGGGLWKQSKVARSAYLIWCMTIPPFMMTFPEALNPYLIPAYLGALVILAWGYSFVSRYARRE